MLDINMQKPRRPKMNHYQRLIWQATRAPVGDLVLIENIMREEIFHSTLDWQTREQLVQAAHEAQRRLNDDRELYNLEYSCRMAMLQKMRAESAVRECDTADGRAALDNAAAKYETAKTALFARLDDLEKQ